MPAISRRRFLATGAGFLAAPAIARPARAARRLTVASLLGPDKPETRIWRHVAASVEAALPGRFSFNIVTDAALGAERAVAEGIRLGSIQASLLTVSALSAWVPETQLLDLPFLFRDGDHLRRALAGETGAELAEHLAGERFIVGGWIDYGARHLLAKTPIARPAELAGLRMRVIQSPLHTRLWEAYGAVPAAIPITEVYNALSTGVVEAMDLTRPATAAFKLYEVVPWLIETAHIRAAGVACYSAAFWNGLSEEEQTVFAAASLDGARHFAGLMAAEDEKAAAEIAAGGGRTLALSAEDRAPWIAGARPVWQELAPGLGGMQRIEAIHAG